MVDVDLRNDNLARKLAEEDIQRAVMATHANALQGPEDMRRAFNAALHLDGIRHPSISEAIPRRRIALDVRQLCYFVAVAEELSFAGAADRLNVAQSAVSLQIKGLEEALGARLLNRRKRAAVSLTEAGRLFLSEAKAAIRQLERAEQVGRLAARERMVGDERHAKSFAMNHTGRYSCRVAGARLYQGRIQPTFGERVELPRRLHRR